MQPLSAIRVLDVSTVIAAPFAAVLMADFGADVIKIEMPKTGDPFRALGPYHKGKACGGRRWQETNAVLHLIFARKKERNCFYHLLKKAMSS